MQLATVSTNTVRTGTCPHGLPLGACPICNGMGGGGGSRKADFSAKPGEMSWNQCAAIGAFLKAQANAKLQRQQDLQNFAANLQNFQNALAGAHDKTLQLAKFINQNMPATVAKPVNFLLNNIVARAINLIKDAPVTILKTAQFLQAKFTEIADKLTAIMGELKAALNKKISDSFKTLKKKLKSVFSIFQTSDSENEDEKIEEIQKTFELKTFIHKLYKKLTENEKGFSNE